MSLIGKLAVSIIGEDTLTDKLKLIEKNAKQWQRNINKIGNNLTNTGRLLTTSLTVPILGVGGAMVKSAMDAVESENLFDVSMGKMAESARSWSEELRQQLGLNSYEVRKNVGTFNVMLESLGLTEQAAFDMSKSMTQLAYDMASFYNIDNETAFEKLRSGLVGQVRPLRELGINIEDATIKAYAYQNGIAKMGEELTQTEKVMARFGVIMEQTGVAQGDLARTIDSPANQLRVLKSEIGQAATEFGVAMMPAIQQLMSAAKPLADKILEMARAFAALAPETQKNVVMTVALAAALGPALMIAGQLVKTMGLLVTVVKKAAITITAIVALASKISFAFKAMAAGAATFGEAMAFAAPQIALVVAAAAALAAGITWLIKKQREAKDSTKQWTAAERELQQQIDRRNGIIQKSPVTKALEELDKQLKAVDEQGKVYGSMFDSWGAKAAAYQATIDELINMGMKAEGETITGLIALMKRAQAQSQAWQKQQQTSATTNAEFTKTVENLYKKAALLGESYDLNAALASAYQSEIERLVEAGQGESEQVKKLVAVYMGLTAAKEEVKQTTMELTGAQQAAVDFYKALIDIEAKENLLGDDFDENAALISAYETEINRLIEAGEGETEQCGLLIAKLRELKAATADAKKETYDLTAAEEEAAAKLERTMKAISEQREDEIGLIEQGIQAELNRITLDQEWTDKLATETTSRKKLLQQEKDAALALAEQQGIGRQNILAYYAIKEVELIRDTMNQWLGIAQNVINQINGLFAQHYQNRKTEIDNWYEQQKKALKARYKDEEQYDAALKKLDEQAAAKRKELLHKQAKQQKAFAIFSAIIDAFSAFVKALASAPPPMNFVLAGAAYTAGMANAALIAAQPLPELAKGGVATSATQAIIGEGVDDEAILPLNQQVYASIAEGIMAQLAKFAAPAHATATAGGSSALLSETSTGGTDGVHLHFHDLVIADEIGVKKLARKIDKALMDEKARRGE
jgi:hypothetical protein